MNESKRKRGGKPFQDLTGMKFGKLTAMNLMPSRGGATIWSCACDCGNEAEVRAGHLKSGKTQSCGCKQRESVIRKNRSSATHRMSGTSLYVIWVNMRRRCLDPRMDSYANYGAKGIKICDRWNESFAAFLEDMGQRPSSQHSIDRIDNDGDYCPENCRWATPKQQQRNKSDNRLIESRGEIRCLAEWAEIAGVGTNLIYGRLASGWSVDAAIWTPPKRKAVAAR